MSNLGLRAVFTVMLANTNFMVVDCSGFASANNWAYSRISEFQTRTEELAPIG